MIYCRVPSPAICQCILIPVLSKIQSFFSPPFSFVFVEGDSGLQCCLKG